MTTAKPDKKRGQFRQKVRFPVKNMQITNTYLKELRRRRNEFGPYNFSTMMSNQTSSAVLEKKVTRGFKILIKLLGVLTLC